MHHIIGKQEAFATILMINFTSFAFSLQIRQKVINPELRLLNHLMAGYNPIVRPVVKSTDVVKINFSLGLSSLTDFDEKQQVLNVNLWIRSTWYNPFCSWAIEDFDNITVLTLPASLLWTPDFVIHNAIGNMYNEQFYSIFRITVYYNGTVSWTPAGDQKFQCRMDVRYFPFDTQICALIFESWKYTVDQVVMFPEGNIKVPEYEHEIWDIVAASAAQQESLYYTGNFSSVSFSFKLKRKSMYFVIYMVAPTVMLAILNLFLFVLPPSSGEKVSLGMTIILSYFVFLLLVAEHLPQTSEKIPLFTMYLCSVIIMSVLSLICAIAVINLHKYNSDRRVPKWLKKLISRFFVSDVNNVGPELSDNNIIDMEVMYKNVETDSPDLENIKDISGNVVLKLTSKYVIKNALEQRKKDWILVAKLLDQFFFICFIIIFIAVTIAFAATESTNHN